MTLLIEIRGGMSLDGAFPALRVGEAYYGRVTASGGTPFYTYQVIKGALPAGLTFDTITGEVTGTPTLNETSVFTVRATDLQGMYVDVVFVLLATVYNTAHVYTSQLYGIFVDGGEDDAPLVTGGKVDNLRIGALQQSDADSPLVSGGSVQALALTATISYGEHDQPQDDADSPLVTGGSVQALSITVTVSYGTHNQPQDDADSPLVTGGSVQALNLQVTTGYVTYNAAQDDSDSPLVTGGSVTNLSITVP